MPFKKGEIPEGATPFKPGESGNPNGRPRKMVSQVIKELGDNGIENVTNSQVIGAIETLLNCQKGYLLNLSQDESHSMLIRIVAKNIINAESDGKLLDQILDRAFGKPNQKTEISGGLEIKKIQRTIVDPANE